jgi:hypothetical protein
MKKHHYVYHSYEEWGREYIGCRSCDCLPKEDTKYFGTFEDNTFKPIGKTILFVCKTRKKVLEIEILLHDFFDVAVNSQFANQAKQTSTKFNFNAKGLFRWKNELTQEQRLCFDEPEGEGWERGVLQKSKDKNRASHRASQPMPTRRGGASQPMPTRRGAFRWKNELLQEQRQCVERPEGEGWERGLLQKTKEKCSVANLGRKYPPMSPMTEERKKKLSEKMSGENCYLFGRTGALHHCSKPITIIKPDGTELHFVSAKEAAKAIKASSIQPYINTDKSPKKGDFKDCKFIYKNSTNF